MVKLKATAFTLLTAMFVLLAKDSQACTYKKNRLKCKGDIANVLQKTGEEARRPVEKTVEEAGKVVRKTAQEIGNGAEAMDRGRLHLQKEIEKQGGRLSDAMKWAVDFSLSCPDPLTLPSAIAPEYEEACSPSLRKWKAAADSCGGAGGLSMIAMGLANSWQTFGASLALAKTAFEMCEYSCGRKAKFDACMSSVSNRAEVAAQQANERQASNDRRKAHLAAAECAVTAIGEERIWRNIETIRICEEMSDCDPTKPESKTFILDRNEKINAVLQQQIDLVWEYADKQSDLPDGMYGAHLKSKSDKLVLTTAVKDKEPTDFVCYTNGPTITLWSRISGKSGSAVTHRWRYGNAFVEDTKVTFSKELDVNSNAWRTWSTLTLPADKPGKWTVDVVDAEKQVLGAYVFWSSPRTAGQLGK